MLSNFHLTALFNDHGTVTLRRINLSQDLQRAMAQGWSAQLDSFLEDVQEIDFNAGYKPESNERFRLNDFSLPAGISGHNSTTVQTLEGIESTQEAISHARAVVAFARDTQRREVVLFQTFTKSHVISPGRFLFLDGDTYVSSERPCLTLGNQLAAIYSPHNSKLLFQNFRAANAFLALADTYQEASADEIRRILSHRRLAPVDAEALATQSSQWSRTRFAMLRDSRVLDSHTPQDIQQRSEGLDINIQVTKRAGHDQIVFPADKVEAKKLLQFLNEEIYKGAITETLYETNSKRQAD